MSRRFWAVWVLLALLSAAARAHNPDTSYARCRVADDTVELRLTFDVFTLLKIVDLDANQDQRLTREELRGGTPAIQRFLRAHVLLEIDGQPADLGDALDAVWPDGAGDSLAAPDWHAAASLIAFPFRRHVSTPPHEVALTYTFFPQFGARHTVLGVFAHGGQTQEVTFTDAEPDYLFDVSYTATPPRETIPAAVGRFLRLGIEHIFLGYDHICFLLALIVVSRLGELVKIITSFTVAHSITLILAALKVITLPQRFIECGIALTIIYVAVENLWRANITRRWVLTFFFGLIHGFGFANVLAGLDLPRKATIRCLLSFNVGVEIGQFAIVLLALPLVLLVSKQSYAPQVKAAISLAVALFGLGWLIERAFGLGFMPI
ncbi:MAG: HupE/UreJ family protein [Chthoniobacter sp.]|uniref:HupE/UreJ family protein n=1 Tax=Chthoniobacter sp. TaxID=2510640 RepID=UPI0032A3BD41